jgi:hypothetical protein
MSETREIPNSFRDPFWRNLAAVTEERVGIPRGLLRAIVEFGEKSDNNQVSPANARTVFQIIPSTRDAFLRKYGVDAYLGPEQAAEVAALHLKESLERNNNSISAAIGEYHGGPSRRAWGPVTNAYIARTLGGFRRLINGAADDETPAQRVRYENVLAAFEEANPTDAPVMRAFEAYRAGRMTPEDAASFEQEVRAGNIMLPRGAGLIGENIGPTETRPPLEGGATGVQAPQGVLDAYSQNRMTQADRITFENLVKAGQMTVPQGFQIGQTPPAGTPRRAMTAEQRAMVDAFPRQPVMAPAGAAPASAAAPMPGGPVQPPQAAPEPPQAPFAAPVRGEYAAEGMAAGAAMPFTAPSAAPAPQAPAVPQAQPVAPPVAGPRTETTAGGLAGAITRGASPTAMGALAGGALGSVLPGVGTLFGAGMGATAGALAPVAGDPAVAFINRQFGTNFTQPTEALNELFRRAGIMEPATATERVVEAGAQTASMGGAQAAMFRQLAQRAARDPNSLAGRVYQALAAGPRAQVGGAAGAGAGGQVAAEMGMGEAGQLAGSVLGGLGGAGAASLRVGTPPQIAGTMAQAERAGVPVMTSDVVPPRTFIGNWLRRIGEAVPLVGTGGQRAAQQQARIEAVQNILRANGASETADAIADVSASVIAKRAEQITKYTDQKKAVINGVSSTQPVPVSRVTDAIDQELAKAEMNTNAFAPVRSALQRWRDDLQGQNLQSLEQLRVALGQVFEAPELASIRTAGEKIISRLYAPLRDDMGEFIKAQSGDAAFNKWQVANRRLSDMIGELKNDSLKAILDRGEATPEIARRLLFSTNRSDVQLLYRSLTPEGQQRARAAVLEDALQKATTGTGEINPTRFASELQKRGTSIGVLFNGRDLEDVQGLVKILNLTRRAQEASVVTSTGQMGVPFIGAATLGELFGAGGALVAGAVPGLMARMYEGALGRNILTRLSRAPAGSDMETRLANQVINNFRDRAAEASRSEIYQ